jgi:ubiquinone/menaquinone biosynthesis C-methylase UbiE
VRDRQTNGLFERLKVGEGTRLIDVACGSGFAAHLATDLGATVLVPRGTDRKSVVSGKSVG